jgi:radical SAM-linked protein
MSRERASRYRVTFAKTDEMRFTSHLDLQRTWERLMRRAALPLLFSEGFHPRPRFNFGSALPLGATGDAEICDLYLTEPVAEEALLDRLRRAAPPGLAFRGVEEVPALAPAVQTLIRSAEYVIDVEGQEKGALAARILELLAAPSLHRERRGKRYDLRPLVELVTLEPVACEGAARLRVTLASRPGATGRPDELLEALGIEATTARVRRTRLLLASPSARVGRNPDTGAPVSGA